MSALVSGDRTIVGSARATLDGGTLKYLDLLQSLTLDETLERLELYDPSRRAI